MSEYTPEKLREWAEHKAQRPSGSFYSCPCLSAGTAKLTDQLRAHADALEKLKVMEEALRAIAQYHRDNSEHWAEMDAGLTMSPRDLSILHSGYAKVAEAPLAAIREKP